MSAYNRRQLCALAFVFSLAPTMRLAPKLSTALAGSGSFITPLIALPFIIMYIAFLSAFMKNRRAGEGMGELILRTSGRGVGSAALILIALNAIFYCGFILRSGADRFVASVYPSATAFPFICVMLVLGFLAALGSQRAIVRTAKIFAPMLWAVLILVLIFGLLTADFSRLLPVFEDSAVSLFRGAVPIFDIFSAVLLYCAFFEAEAPIEEKRTRHYALWLLPVTALITADIAAIVGNYGAALTAKLSHPFFTMLRDVTLFNTVERIEAFVVALWVIPDFIVFATVLTVGGRCLMLVFGFKVKDAQLKDMSGGHWLYPLCGAVSGAIAFSLTKDASAMERLSTFYVPLMNLIVSVGIVPLCYVVGRIREKI